jgi:pimeloyl-ACP methyl ester carboxylesterase
MLTLRSVDGTTIAYRQIGTGAPFVLVGGALNDHTQWDAVAESLAEHGTVYAMDRRGRGESGDKAGSTVADEVDDVRALLAEAGDGAVLVGHSSGALLALRAAADRPDLRAVVAYEPPVRTGVGTAPARLRALIDSGDRETALITFLTELVGMPAQTVAAERETPNWQQRLALVDTIAYDAAIVESGLSRSDAKAITAPVRLLLGGESGRG